VLFASPFLCLACVYAFKAVAARARAHVKDIWGRTCAE